MVRRLTVAANGDMATRARAGIMIMGRLGIGCPSGDANCNDGGEQQPQAQALVVVLIVFVHLAGLHPLAYNTRNVQAQA